MAVTHRPDVPWSLSPTRNCHEGTRVQSFMDWKSQNSFSTLNPSIVTEEVEGFEPPMAFYTMADFKSAAL